jgi:ferredoxin-like protein FixX
MTTPLAINSNCCSPNRIDSCVEARLCPAQVFSRFSDANLQLWPPQCLEPTPSSTLPERPKATFPSDPIPNNHTR